MYLIWVEHMGSVGDTFDRHGRRRAPHRLPRVILPLVSSIPLHATGTLYRRRHVASASCSHNLNSSKLQPISTYTFSPLRRTLNFRVCALLKGLVADLSPTRPTTQQLPFFHTVASAIATSGRHPHRSANLRRETSPFPLLDTGKALGFRGFLPRDHQLPARKSLSMSSSLPICIRLGTRRIGP